nr:ATP-binding cassette domain-containing protein [Desulfatitalea alkaliphila]
MRRVSKSIRGRPVLRDLTLRLAKGDMVCLTGPSGIGKTTLLEIAAGIRAPDIGTCVRGPGRIGCALQDAPLLPWRTALENMDFMLAAAVPSATRSELARTWLENLGLADAAAYKPHAMSGGMRRRLAIAAALAVGPDLLLLDEPFSFLDDHWQRVVAQLVHRLNQSRGTTVLMVSHQFEPLRHLGAAMVAMDPSPDGVTLYT